MVTSGPLLPWWTEGSQECRYLCDDCGRRSVVSEQYVTFGPGDTPPRWLPLPCYGAALDARTGIQRVPMHLYMLAEPGKPAGDEQGGGSQGADAGGPRSGAQRP